MPTLKQKALVYITWGDKLLVFSHPDFPEAGIQVPAGTIEPGEEPGAAVFVTPMRTWDGQLVTKNIQFERGGHFWEYVPTKGPQGSTAATPHIA